MQGSKADRKAEREERKRQKKLEKLAKAHAFAGNQDLPEKVAQNSQLPEFLDGNNYQLIFAKYNHKECEIADLASNQVEALIKKFSRITELDKNTIAGGKIIRDNVQRDGQYKSLFEYLEPDVELKEAEYFGTGRIFFYLVHTQTNNYCCIVSVKQKHIETK